MMKRIFFMLTAGLLLFGQLAGAVPVERRVPTLTYHGHAAFQAIHGDTSIVIDPFFKGNPASRVKPEDIPCNYVLVSHGHFDHVGDAAEIAKNNDATVISTFELANMFQEKGCKVFPMHIGGKHAFDFGYVRVTPALHGAGVPGGEASGFIINFHGKNIYFAGDTGLFGDMALLNKFEKIDYALIPIGDTFTMGPDEAVEAIGMIKPKYVIPMHYNTWPMLKQDVAAFKNKVEKRYRGVKVLILEPGQTIEL